MTPENIIASFIGGGLLLLIQLIWKYGLPYFIIRFLSDEPTISGRWTTIFQEEGKEYSEKVELTQIGRKISADIKLKDGEDEYKFVGIFKDRILSGTYYSTNTANFERGAILLNYVSVNVFEGTQSYFSKSNPKEVVSSSYRWEKVKQ